MRFPILKSTGLRKGALAGLALVFPQMALAHERFIKHDMKNPMQDGFFLQQAGKFLGMDPNMVQIGLLVSLVLSAFIFIWFLRESLDEFIRYSILSRLSGWPQRFLHRRASALGGHP